MRDITRYIIGYTIGFSVFIILVPFGLYKLSKIDFSVFSTTITSSDTLRYALSIPILIVGAFFAIWSNVFLFIVGKGGPAEGFNVAISPKTKKLVTTGPYSYCRNPMVFGAFSLYISIAIYLNSIGCLITILLLIVLAIIYLKFSEEKRLLRDFGNEYRDYKQRVSMLLPIKQMKK